MKKFIFLLLILIIAALGFTFWWKNGIEAVNPADQSQQRFSVAQGESSQDVAGSLKVQGLIRDPLLFLLVLQRDGLEGKIQAGDYLLTPSMNMRAIEETLSKGPMEIQVTFPEGIRATEMAAILKAQIPSYDPSWDTMLAAQEGYLFPDTYFFTKDTNITTVIQVMKQNFANKFSSVYSAPATALAPTDIVTLASLIQREAKTPEDMKLVSSVLQNRLKIGMALQVDATIQYALGYQPVEKSWWKKSLSADDLKITSAYNTYTNVGLPPSPICNPGQDALDAVVHPASTRYLYYISDKNGLLHFAQTLEEQNANIAKYGL